MVGLPTGASAKDLILALIGKYVHDFATGYVIEYRGEAIKKLSSEERMTVCNMSIEIGARAGLIAPDKTTYAYLKDKPKSPNGELWNEALSHWQEFYSDEDAVFDMSVDFDVSEVAPQVTWGTNPGLVTAITEISINTVFIGSCTNSRIEDLREVAKIV